MKKRTTIALILLGLIGAAVIYYYVTKSKADAIGDVNSDEAQRPNFDFSPGNLIQDPKELFKLKTENWM